LPLLDDAASELFGFMVREAVTNVIRHAGASVCTIEASEGSITVSDDGRGMGRPALQSGGTGLAGLRARLQDAGGDLDVASDETGTRVRARLRDRANREGTP
jgi:two-component system sensor histidine kinase DesK